MILEGVTKAISNPMVVYLIIQFKSPQAMFSCILKVWRECSCMCIADTLLKESLYRLFYTMAIVCPLTLPKLDSFTRINNSKSYARNLLVCGQCLRRAHGLRYLEGPWKLLVYLYVLQKEEACYSMIYTSHLCIILNVDHITIVYVTRKIRKAHKAYQELGSRLQGYLSWTWFMSVQLHGFINKRRGIGLGCRIVLALVHVTVLYALAQRLTFALL